jgi:hypothetical protein
MTMLPLTGTVRGLAPSVWITTEEGPGGSGGSAAAPPFLAVRRDRGADSTVSPRTAHRIERQMNSSSSANSPYFSAERANGVTLWANVGTGTISSS